MLCIKKFILTILFLLIVAIPLTPVQAQERIIVKFKDNSFTPEFIKQKAAEIEKKQRGNLFEKMQSQFMIWEVTNELGDSPLNIRQEIIQTEKEAHVTRQFAAFAQKPKNRTQADHNRISSIRVMQLSEQADIETAIDAYNNLENVEWAVYDAPVEMFLSPNDQYYNQQWSLNQSTDRDIDAPEAWDLTQGNPSSTVAVIDSGVDRNHPDLNDNVFKNPGEVAGNGVDDDANGYVDDVYGWNFLQNNNDTFDVDGHGTHVSGIIAAETNNSQGVSGITKSKILPLRIFISGGVDERTSDVLRAIQYTADNAQRFNIKALNMSFGATRARTDENASDVCVAYEPVLKNLYTKGVSAVAAAGNGSGQLGPDTGIPYYTMAPAGCYGVISVGATIHNDTLAGFSNFGPGMTLSAPGASYPALISTCPGGSYCEKAGTSMAAPHVAGVISLMTTVNPALNHWHVRHIFSQPSNLDPIEGASVSKFPGHGRLNAKKALDASYTAPSIAEPGTMTIRSEDITASFTSYNPTQMQVSIQIKVRNESNNQFVHPALVVFSLKAPDGQTRYLSAYTEADTTAKASAFFMNLSPSALRGNYQITVISVASNMHAYRPTTVTKSISSTGTNPTSTIPSATVIPTAAISPTSTRTPTPTAIIINTPTPTISSGGTKTCYQPCFYAYECGPTAPYCVRSTGLQFSYCSASPSILTCTPTGPSNTPIPTSPANIPTPTRTPTPNQASSCFPGFSCRTQTECKALGGSATGQSCGSALYCCYGK